MFGPALVYDLGRIIDGGPADPIGKVPPGAGPASVAAGMTLTGRYHDMYVAYDAATKEDKFYGAGLSAGYFVYDVTQPQERA